MKINRGALIFGGIVVAVVAAVAAMVWFTSLFTAAPSGTTSGASAPNFFSSLFPFGNATRNLTTAATSSTTENQPGGAVPRLREVSQAPVAGFHFQKDGSLRYGEVETGHLFETRPESLSTVRISNTTIPAIKNISWLSDASFVLQYLDETGAIRNYAVTLASSTPDQTLLGHFLSNVTEVFGSDDTHILEAAKSFSGITVSRAKNDETGKVTLFSSPLRSWKVLPTAKDVFIETAPYSGSGFLFKIRPDGGLEKIIGDTPGLMALVRQDGKYIAYSNNPGGRTTLNILDVAKQKTYAAPLAALAEKCAWVPVTQPILFCGVSDSFAGTSIEGWYMGGGSFSDHAWIIDPIQGTATVEDSLIDAAGNSLDVMTPSVSPDGNYAAFINKNDLSLWSLKLTQ